jgi:hypothetical protein
MVTPTVIFSVWCLFLVITCGFPEAQKHTFCLFVTPPDWKCAVSGNHISDFVTFFYALPTHQAPASFITSSEFIHHRHFVWIQMQVVSYGSTVGIATAYGLDDQGVRVRVPVVSEYSLLHIIQTSSGAHPVSYSMGTGGFFPRGKAAGHEAHHSPPTSAEIKKMWNYTFIPPYTFMVLCLIS